jgi:hypothetical protein
MYMKSKFFEKFKTLIKNRKFQALFVFGLLCISVVTNIILLQKPNSTNLKTITDLQTKIENQDDNVKNLNREIGALQSKIDTQDLIIKKYEKNISKNIDETKNSLDENGEKSSPNDLPLIENNKNINSINQNTNNTVLTKDTAVSLRGEGCKFSTYTEGDELSCDLINSQSNEIVKKLIDCKKNYYLTYPVGTKNICVQGADLSIGKPNSLGVNLINIATSGDFGVTLQPYSIYFNDKKIVLQGSYYATPRSSGIAEDASIIQLGKDFTKGYKNYVGDTVPPDYYIKYFIYD